MKRRCFERDLHSPVTCRGKKHTSGQMRDDGTSDDDTSSETHHNWNNTRKRQQEQAERHIRSGNHETSYATDACRDLLHVGYYSKTTRQFETAEQQKPLQEAAAATYCNMSPENAIAHRVCKYGAQSSHRGKGSASAKAPRGKTCDPPAPRGVALTKPCGTRTGAQNQFISNHQPYHPDRITSPSKHRSGMHYYISGTLSLVPGTLYLCCREPLNLEAPF